MTPWRGISEIERLARAGVRPLTLVVLQAQAAGPSRGAGPGKPSAGPGAAGNRVAAEGRRVAYPGAEVVVGTDLAGTVVILNVREKDHVRRGHAPSGETLEAGERIVTNADLSRARVEADLDAFDSGRVRLDDAVRVTAEGYDGRAWKGRVEPIPDAAVGRRLKPQDPGKPEDTRALLVKVALLEPTPLKLGQRVETRIP